MNLRDLNKRNLLAAKKREARLLAKIQKLEAANRGTAMWLRRVDQRLAKLEQR